MKRDGPFCFLASFSLASCSAFFLCSFLACFSCSALLTLIVVDSAWRAPPQTQTKLRMKDVDKTEQLGQKFEPETTNEDHTNSKQRKEFTFEDEEELGRDDSTFCVHTERKRTAGKTNLIKSSKEEFHRYLSTRHRQGMVGSFPSF